MIENELLRKCNIIPTGYKKLNSATLVSTKNNKFIFKKDKNDLDKIFTYLESRNFNYFPKSFRESNYDVYEYIEDLSISKEEKALDLINLVSLLHTKTTHYKNIDIDDYKVIYEEIDKKLNELLEYYLTLNDYIDSEVFMSPSSYLLARNISKIYALIDYLKNELSSWYDLIKEKDKQRVTLIHNNLELNHLLRNTNSYLISWDNAKFDIPVYDLYKLYKKNYKDIDFSVLLNEYENRYPLLEEEKKLLFILISIPNKLELNNNEYNNTKKVKELLDYIYKTDKIISPYYSNQNKEE